MRFTSMAKVNLWSYGSLASSTQTHAQSSAAGDRLSSTTRLGSSRRGRLSIVAREMSCRSVTPSYHRHSFYT
ncbi:unnamed protein product [Penicillium camemberti]|uniref:Str. FM013 n=1 Tax=Penicillium camemberti (strain FM 013) TaxID=1429867 RepID=A0A0G4PF73_PENC3|nr:unnamed protein product [Penicillium camemberti]